LPWLRIAAQGAAAKQLQFLHLLCLPSQLRIAADRPKFPVGGKLPSKKEKKMRYVEMATSSVVALAAQVLVIAVVLI
jgi:hypothetical protein